jgi:hypothetical protein
METTLYILIGLAAAALVARKVVSAVLSRREKNRCKKDKCDGECAPKTEPQVFEPEESLEAPEHCCYLLKPDRWCKRKPKVFAKVKGRIVGLCKQHAEIVIVDIYEGQDPNDDQDNITLDEAFQNSLETYAKLDGDLSKILSKK